MGISKVEELANCDIQRLTERFGKMGLWLKQVANGNDCSEVKEWDAAVKSISRSRTFGEDTNDPEKLQAIWNCLLRAFTGLSKKIDFCSKWLPLWFDMMIFPHIHVLRL
jgi:DNA polymerase IV (archaeal DinB-like DNA polymerase)